REFIGLVGAAPLAGERGFPMGLQLGLPLVQMVAPQTQLAGHGGRRASRTLPQPNGFELELFGEWLSLGHRTPPRGYCPLFEVSTKVGLAQPVPFSSPKRTVLPNSPTTGASPRTAS